MLIPSPIQIDIITRLITSSGLRYSEARPTKVENDLYKYHLRFLVQKGYVKKIDDRYHLTQKGKLFGLRINAKGEVQDLFNIHIACYAVRKKRLRKKILLQKKAKHPYYGDVFVISGKLRKGEKVEQAAKRKFEEETGLVCDFKFVGLIRKVRRDTSRKVIQDSLFFVCHGENPRGTLIQQNVFGKNFWVTFDKAIKLCQKNLTYSKLSIEVFKKLQQNDLSQFYFHDEIEIEAV